MHLELGKKGNSMYKIYTKTKTTRVLTLCQPLINISFSKNTWYLKAVVDYFINMSSCLIKSGENLNFREKCVYKLLFYIF